MRLGDKAKTILSLESALTDVTCIVLTVGLLDAATRGDAGGAHLAGKAISSLISAGVVGMVAGMGWLLIHRRLREVPNTRLAIIAGVLVLYGMVEAIGFSGGIAALSFGITAGHFSRPGAPAELAGQPIGKLSRDEHELFGELVFLCKLIFFIYLGINLRFDSLTPFVNAGIAIGVVYLARILLAKWLLPRDCTVRDAAVTAIMAPKGLAAAVLASTVVQAMEAAGMPKAAEIKEFVYAAVLVSIVGTSVLVPLVELPPTRWLARRFFSRHSDSMHATRATTVLTPVPAEPVAPSTTPEPSSRPA
jgi:potassium/hydrogen antiporter